MVAFFMLSGFSLYYVDSQHGKFFQTTEYAGIGKFLKKRILGLYPLYITIYILFTAVSGLQSGHINVLKELTALPVELTMLQSVLIGSFSFSHNGGTWFISCIFVCYIFYPYVTQVVNNNSRKNNILLGAFLYCIASYAFLPTYRLHFSSIYANPMLRLVEFSLGVIFCKFFIENIEKDIKKICVGFIFLSYVILICGITLGVHFLKPWVELYNFIAIPCFGFILYFSARIEMKHEITSCRKIISILSENTYAFFLAQFFSWQPIRYLMNNTDVFETHASIKKIIISTIWTCFVTIVLHYGIEKPCKKCRFLKP